LVVTLVPKKGVEPLNLSYPKYDHYTIRC